MLTPSLAAAVLALTPLAGPPAGTLDQLRAEAELAVTIHVLSVSEDVHGEGKDVTVTAKVLAVERSAFGTKTGEQITIAYADAVKPIPGSPPMPALEEGGVYPAFLNRSGTGYQPAAGAASFRMTPEGVRAKGNGTAAERLGAGLRTVDTLLKATPADPNRGEMQKAVVRFGQSGELNAYVWVHARLKWECWFLEARKVEAGENASREQVKAIDDQVAYLKRTLLIIDAPR